MLIKASDETFEVTVRKQRDGHLVYDFLWLNGPEGYGFTFGKTLAPGVLPTTLTHSELEREAKIFVKAFFAPDGIGLADFPDFVSARRSRLAADEG